MVSQHNMMHTERDRLHQEDRYDTLKLIFLSCAFFCVIGAYTVTKEIKNSVFSYTVGRKYIPWARVIVMIALVPAILFYAKLVDRVRRYQLLCFYSLVYAIFGLLFAYYLGHPDIGIPNTQTSPYRLIGWLFYFFIEGCSPFVVSVCWAFANSVTSPEGARKNYGRMVSGSKLGGMLTAGLAWIMLRYEFFGNGDSRIADLHNHQILLVLSSVLLFMVPIVIFFMVRRIPAKFLHGYEAAYQAEKHKKVEAGMFSGLKLLFKYPYVLGIFGMSFFYEVLATVLSYLTITEAQTSSNSMSEALAYLLEIAFMAHFVGFFISYFGTTALFNKLGTRRCLMLIPLTSGLALLYFMLSSSTATALQIVFVLFRSINYAFSWPLRESLYIPTIKEIKFKSKSWVDAFGSKFAKSSGSAFNLFIEWMGPALIVLSQSIFFATLIGCWLITAWVLGRRFERAVARNEVIGIEEV